MSLLARDAKLALHSCSVLFLFSFVFSHDGGKWSVLSIVGVRAIFCLLGWCTSAHMQASLCTYNMPPPHEQARTAKFLDLLILMNGNTSKQASNLVAKDRSRTSLVRCRRFRRRGEPARRMKNCKERISSRRKRYPHPLALASSRLCGSMMSRKKHWVRERRVRCGLRGKKPVLKRVGHLLLPMDTVNRTNSRLKRIYTHTAYICMTAAFTYASCQTYAVKTVSRG